MNEILLFAVCALLLLLVVLLASQLQWALSRRKVAEEKDLLPLVERRCSLRWSGHTNVKGGGRFSVYERFLVVKLGRQSQVIALQDIEEVRLSVAPILRSHTRLRVVHSLKSVPASVVVFVSGLPEEIEAVLVNQGVDVKRESWFNRKPIAAPFTPNNSTGTTNDGSEAEQGNDE